MNATTIITLKFGLQRRGHLFNMTTTIVGNCAAIGGTIGAAIGSLAGPAAIPLGGTVGSFIGGYIGLLVTMK